MQILNLVLTIAPALAAAMLGAIYFVHMLQLASYQFGYYWRWILKNMGNAFSLRRAMALLALLPIFAKSANVGVFFAAVFVMYIMLNRLKKAKKPLVYTARVKRLLCTVLIIVLIPAALFACGFGFAIYILAGLIFLMPCVLMLANLINMPIESMVTNYYVSDARKKLQQMDTLTVIGITGSFGKTSTKYFLNAILSVKYNVLMSPGNYNTTLGAVRTVRELLRPTHEIFICEMGARHRNDIKEICDLVHPKYGVITSIGEQHLESFLTVENIVKTKFELADSIPESGFAFLNFENELIRKNAKGKNIVSYGSAENIDYAARDILISGNGTEFKVTAPDGATTEFRTKLLGEHNVQNITAAIAVGHKLGIPMAKIQAAVRALECVPHRMELIRGGNFTVIDDAYNSNPKGAKAALDTLMMCEGTKILVTPGMVELGAREKELNFEFGQQAAKACDYIALVGAKQTEPIRQGVLKEGFDESKLCVADNLQQALDFAKKSGDPAKPKFVLLENDLPDNY